MIHRLLLPALLLAVAPLAAQTNDRSPVEDIATQPLRDLGIMRTEVADVLQKALDSTYSLAGLKTCAQLRAAVRELDGVLGDDWDRRAASNTEDPAEQIAQAGLRAGVGALIPFRGVVREVTGSAAAERRLRVAVQAGQARRGYLRGVMGTRGCR
jgi:hypothetical protein